MKTKIVIAVMMLTPIFGSSYNQSQTAPRTRTQRPRNRPPKIQSFTSSKSIVDYRLMNSTGECSSDSPVAILVVKATDSDNDELTYEYSVSTGRIVGEGTQANWDLNRASLGSQTAKVEVRDGRGGKASGFIKITVNVCGACDLPCPVVTVTCPDDVISGEVAVFTANVWGGDPNRKIRYVWKQSNGKVIGGKRTSKLQVKAGLPGEEVTATAKVLGLDPSCNYEVSCRSKILKKLR